MSKNNNVDGCLAVIAIALFAFVFICGMCWKWYRSGVQVEVYRRQGIEMTQWEVFVGARIAEQTVNIK